MFDNRPNIILNEEFLIELERTGNLANLANRITTTEARLNQQYIQVNTTDITNTVVTPAVLRNQAGVLTTQNIQNQINNITNNNLTQLNNLPNQTQRIRERLTQNRLNLVGIMTVQQEIVNLNANIVGGNTILGLNNQITTLTNELNICRTLGSSFRQRRTERNKRLGLTNPNQIAQCDANIQSHSDAIDTTITNDGTFLDPTLLA
ncbi:MAG: hypothetical protein WCL18_10005 [bacterium]